MAHGTRGSIDQNKPGAAVKRTQIQAIRICSPTSAHGTGELVEHAPEPLLVLARSRFHRSERVRIGLAVANCRLELVVLLRLARCHIFHMRGDLILRKIAIAVHIDRREMLGQHLISRGFGLAEALVGIFVQRLEYRVRASPCHRLLSQGRSRGRLQLLLQ